MVCHWSLSDSKSPQVSRTLLRILADLNNAIVWMVSIHPDICKSSSPWINYLVTEPRTPITNCISECFIIIIIIIIINIIIYSFRVFHISVSWWFFTGVWVTASFLKSPGLFSVFWPFSVMLSFGWSLPVHQLPSPQWPFNNPSVIVPKALILICTIVTFMFHSFFNSLARSGYLSIFSLSFSFILWSAGTEKSTILQILLLLFFFVEYYLGLVFWPRLSNLCVCQSPMGVYASHFPGQVLRCAYTIC